MKKWILPLLMMVAQLTNAQELDIQGHRGARGLLPENTIPALYRILHKEKESILTDVEVLESQDAK